MLIVLSADAVARSAMSGENLTDVIPRACAREMVVRGVNLSAFAVSAVPTAGGLTRERERERSSDEL